MAFDKKSFSDVYEAMAADTRRRIPALTDFEEGSVVRSLYETFAYEMALLYEQMDLVYQAGFVDTAAGSHLDRVVAVLGITRDEPDFATGEVTFERDPGSDEEVTIPIRTLLTTEEDETKDPSKKAYVTTEEGRLAVGQVSVAVKVQAEERGQTMMTESESIIVMPRPVSGVKAVINKKPIRFLGRDRETDEELRERAKKALLASGRASITSIETALLGLPGVREVRLREDFPEDLGKTAEGEEAPSNGQQKHLGLGVVEVYVDGLNPQNAKALRERLDQVRAAGVYVILKPAVAISLEAVLRIDIEASIHSEERLVLEHRVRDAVVHFVDRLRMGQPLLFSRLTREVLNIRGVTDLPEFKIVTFREADAFAEGEVRLTRSSGLDKNISIPARTPLQTATQQNFLIKAEVQLDENKPEVTATVQAVAAGRAGELIRTGSAISWASLKINDIVLTVVNDAPILLERHPHAPEDKRIDVKILERFVPESIRVASEEKRLSVHVQVHLLKPGADREAQRKAIEEAVGAFFASLTVGQGFKKSDLQKPLDTLSLGDYVLTLMMHPFQGSMPEDDFSVQASFVEKPVPEVIFVYTHRVELTGHLTLVLSLTATDEEKRRASEAVRQTIKDYLEDLQPEEDIALDRIRTFAVGHEKVLRVEFKLEDCALVRLADGEVLADRNKKDTMSIEAFEKVFLAQDDFVITA